MIMFSNGLGFLLKAQELWVFSTVEQDLELHVKVPTPGMWFWKGTGTCDSKEKATQNTRQQLF